MGCLCVDDGSGVGDVWKFFLKCVFHWPEWVVLFGLFAWLALTLRALIAWKSHTIFPFASCCLATLEVCLSLVPFFKKSAGKRVVLCVTWDGMDWIGAHAMQWAKPNSLQGFLILQTIVVVQQHPPCNRPQHPKHQVFSLPFVHFCISCFLSSLAHTLSTCESICITVLFSTSLSVSVCLFVCLPVCLSVCPSLLRHPFVIPSLAFATGIPSFGGLLCVTVDVTACSYREPRRRKVRVSSCTAVRTHAGREPY